MKLPPVITTTSNRHCKAESTKYSHLEAAAGNPASRIFLAIAIGVLPCLVCAQVSDDKQGLVTYIANEGIMVELGDSRVLFDPLFEYPHDTYQAIPEDTKRAIIEGTGQYEGVDAVLISHFHADHFSPQMILELMRHQGEVQLFATGQAVSALYQVAGQEDQPSFDRVHRIDLAHGDEARHIELESISVEAVIIPHSGWPNMHQHVENLSYRVTLNGELTVVHMGDADPDPGHFNHQAHYWAQRETDAAFPPYWFFLVRGGQVILDQTIQPRVSIGLHIPADPASRPQELAEYDVFTVPGETRLLSPGGK